MVLCTKSFTAIINNLFFTDYYVLENKKTNKQTKNK